LIVQEHSHLSDLLVLSFHSHRDLLRNQKQKQSRPRPTRHFPNRRYLFSQSNVQAAPRPLQMMPRGCNGLLPCLVFAMPLCRCDSTWEHGAKSKLWRNSGAGLEIFLIVQRKRPSGAHRCVGCRIFLTCLRDKNICTNRKILDPSFGIV